MTTTQNPIKNIIAIAPILDQSVLHSLEDDDITDLFSKMFHVNKLQSSSTMATIQRLDEIDTKRTENTQKTEMETHIFNTPLNKSLSEHLSHLFTEYMRSKSPLCRPNTFEYDSIISILDTTAGSIFTHLFEMSEHYGGGEIHNDIVSNSSNGTHPSQITRDLFGIVEPIASFIFACKKMDVGVTFVIQEVPEEMESIHSCFPKYRLSLKLDSPLTEELLVDSSLSDPTPPTSIIVEQKYYEFIKLFLFAVNPSGYCRSIENDTTARVDDWMAPLQSRIHTNDIFYTLIKIYDELCLGLYIAMNNSFTDKFQTVRHQTISSNNLNARSKDFGEQEHFPNIFDE
jgi:hypothetical protein